jgi:hypothetical protein
MAKNIVHIYYILSSNEVSADLRAGSHDIIL